MRPLNPQLYTALKKAFRRVTISKAGLPMVADYSPGPDGRLRLLPIESGEYYVITCPFCHDTEGKLYVNHRWGVRDPRTGTRNRWLANCFLGDCLRHEDNREEFRDRVENWGLYADDEAAPVVQRPAVAAADPRPLPADFVPLADLPKGHPARLYVRGRGFSPAILSRDWGVGFSQAVGLHARHGRLIVPVRGPDGGGWRLAGWQGRAIDPSDKPRYYTAPGTPKSRLLYGLDRVRPGRGPVLLCEGVTDVWRAGGDAVAVLGKTISADQAGLVRQHLGGQPIVVMLDPEAATEAADVAARIDLALDRSLTGRDPAARVVVARLPDGRDPAECTRAEVWAAAERALSPRRGRGPR